MPLKTVFCKRPATDVFSSRSSQSGDQMMKQSPIERLVLGGRGTGKRPQVRGYYARLVRSRSKRPVILAEERDRRVTMVMGPSGIERLVGKSGFDMLIELGHTAEYIEREV